MNPHQLMIQGINVVLRGNFNPAIFQPAWLASQSLIRHSEAEATEISIIHPKATIFKAEWLQINVVEDRFQASTTQEAYYEPLRDLVAGIFNLLSHTPLKVMGINHNFHYRIESEKKLHEIGHRLAPKLDWEDILEKPGMRSLTMEGKREDGFGGYMRVKVEPSTRIEAEFDGYGVYIEVNDHYILPSKLEPPECTNEAIDILSKNWEESNLRAKKIAKRITSLGENK